MFLIAGKVDNLYFPGKITKLLTLISDLEILSERLATFLNSKLKL